MKQVLAPKFCVAVYYFYFVTKSEQHGHSVQGCRNFIVDRGSLFPNPVSQLEQDESAAALCNFQRTEFGLSLRCTCHSASKTIGCLSKRLAAARFAVARRT